MTQLFIALLTLLSHLDVQGGLGVCLRNCAQCKKMFGNFFEGQMVIIPLLILKLVVVDRCS